jgi:hypothetical protein
MSLLPCPCCGYNTLAEEDAFEHCPICWWEDDGQANDDGDVIKGGPNFGLSLTQARINFISYGIAFPNRVDLKEKQKNTTDFSRSRFFREVHGNKIEEISGPN